MSDYILSQCLLTQLLFTEKHYAKCFMRYMPVNNQPLYIGSINISTLQMRKLRPREVNWYLHYHTASKVAESLRWLTHVTNKGKNKLSRVMAALGPIIGPRKPDCTRSCVCVCACMCMCGLVMSHPLWPLLLGSHRIPVSFQELVPFIRGLQGASVLSNTKKQESMRLSRGASTLVLFFPLGHVKGFCYMEIKMSLFQSPPPI